MQIKPLFNSVKKMALIQAVTLVAAFSMPASATVVEEINKAITTGTTNYGLVTAGVVTVASLGFCVGMIVSWLRK